VLVEADATALATQPPEEACEFAWDSSLAVEPHKSPLGNGQGYSLQAAEDRLISLEDLPTGMCW
jgi:hypothetical protein